ncbi:MAG: N-acetylmuramoyl-L-alanine amidase [Oscillospiraceae bacterium]|nr:N-acetylmuramoyl-L-alanine amidase [Oscillospiraceae bacterium]
MSRNRDYTNSPMVTMVRLSPNRTPSRDDIIGFAIHVTGGTGRVANVLSWLERTTTQASYNYVLDDWDLGLCVEEAFRAWSTSSRAIDMRCITIGVVNSVASGQFPISERSQARLIDFLVDACLRNNIARLSHEGDNANLLLKWDRQNLPLHRWTARKACPGQFLVDRMGAIAAEVNRRLAEALGGESNNEIGDDDMITVRNVSGGEWKRGTGENAHLWWYDLGNGLYPINGLFNIGGKTYHFDSRGYMSTGSVVLGRNRFVFESALDAREGALARIEMI